MKTLAMGVMVFATFSAQGSLQGQAQTPPPVFVSNTDLQSLAVRVTDKQGRDVHGLGAKDFTILEDGRTQPVAFFGAEQQPVSVALLLDASWSMRSSLKLERAGKLLAPLLGGSFPGSESEVFFTSFTERIGAFLTVTPGQPLSQLLPNTRSAQAGTALYDALATSLCNMRTARSIRQAIVMITDGSDQHSRLTLDRVIQLAQTSKPQIFMIGLFDPSEHEVYREGGKTVSLVNGREIDNPLYTFNRVAKESGAEAFFPSTDADFAGVVDHILGILRAEYTLAYYPNSAQTLRRIQVRVNRPSGTPGVTVNARRAVGSEAPGAAPVRFEVNSCTVSPTEHPYPWEPHVTTGLPHTSTYKDDFTDPHSGWPNHPFSQYAHGGYEITVGPPPQNSRSASGSVFKGTQLTWGGDSKKGDQYVISTGTIAAYGPLFANFRASITVSGAWKKLLSSDEPGRYSDGGAGIVFRLNEQGCYLFLLSGKGNDEHFSYSVVKRSWSGIETQLVPWVRIPLARDQSTIAKEAIEPVTLTVECSGDRIILRLNDLEVERLTDSSLPQGQVGIAAFGKGRALFHSLYVEERP
jgi:Ca-activated chloride channel family protein